VQKGGYMKKILVLALLTFVLSGCVTRTVYIRQNWSDEKTVSQEPKRGLTNAEKLEKLQLYNAAREIWNFKGR
jgi:PBP1b-binding outer membrane lipoprotein LpoB